MAKYQEAKRVVRDYFNAMENATHENVAEVLKAHTSEDYLWRGVYLSASKKELKLSPRFSGRR